MTAPASASAWAECRQGDAFPLRERYPYSGYQGSACYVVLVSQTCDVVQGSKPTLLVAPLEAWDEGDFKQVRRGQRPLSPPLAPEKTRAVARLEYLTAVDRDWLRLSERMPAPWEVESDPEARAFARRAGYALSRFPIPDHAQPLFARLIEKVKSAAGKPSALGKTLEHVLQLRVKAYPSWHAAELDIDLHIVVHEDQLLPLTASPAQGPGKKPTLSEVCEKLASPDVAGAERDGLWQHFAACLDEELLRPQLDLCPRVRDISVELYSEAEYTFKQYRDSESLNMDALSPAAGPQTGAVPRSDGDAA